MSNTPPDDFFETGMLRVADVAKYLACSAPTVLDLIRAGELTGVRIGKNYRVTKPALAEYVARATVASVAPAAKAGHQ